MSEATDQDMATLAIDASDTPRPFHQRRKSWVRRVERCCFLTLSYFPLTFVYGLTTWAVWVEVQVSFIGGTTSLSYFTAGLGILLYALANISYTTAVFTPPGSPVDSGSIRRGRSGKYESLPTYEEHETQEVDMSMVTAKASGKKRYCKKCKVTKPDRTHHCSTCGKCVLKMDHHCPWLATCVGLRNYKAFLLFLIYTCCFCWTCFAVSIAWTLENVLQDVVLDDGWRLVNTILLAVLGGIIGLVLSGFTGWHIYLSVTGATTIESLEKTRYLNPLRRSLQQDPRRNYLSQDGNHEQQSLTNQLKEIHANALPGVLRPEEGESEIVSEPATTVSSRMSPARASLQRSYASLEAQRDQERYEAYLDEQDSEKMPNAFDLGWKRNLLHLFGPSPLLWPLPVCNTTGDGWKWEVSHKWMVARDEIARGRARRQQEDARWNTHNPLNYQQRRTQDLRWTPGQGFVSQGPPRAAVHDPNQFSSNTPLQPINDGRSMHISTSGDADKVGGSTSNWNDVPDEFLDHSHNRQHRDQSHGRAKGD